MQEYEVTLGKGGSGTFSVFIHASTPDQARRSAEAQNPGCRAQSCRAVY